MIAGGGNIGKRLAEALEDDYQVKLLECDQQRATVLSEELNRSIVLLGDSADEDLLLEENIDQMDVFCAVTNDDEANILSSMLAKQLGAGKVMSLVNRYAYVDLIEKQATVDVAISPQQVTIGALLTHVRRGDVAAVHSLRRGAAEAIEAVAHGDSRTSRVVGRRIEQISLPEGATIGAVVRGEDVMMAHHDTLIESDDHLIIFMRDRRKTYEVEKLFQVSVTFM
jgi:trk system potassium uptake protein TrkA